MSNLGDAVFETKMKAMKVYIPFLEDIMKKLQSENVKPREEQLRKIRMVYELLTKKNAKLTLGTLLKCEQVLIKLSSKIPGPGDLKLDRPKPTTTEIIEIDSPDNSNDVEYQPPVIIPTTRTQSKSFQQTGDNDNVCKDIVINHSAQSSRWSAAIIERTGSTDRRQQQNDYDREIDVDKFKNPDCPWNKTTNKYSEWKRDFSNNGKHGSVRSNEQVWNSESNSRSRFDRFRDSSRNNGNNDRDPKQSRNLDSINRQNDRSRPLPNNCLDQDFRQSDAPWNRDDSYRNNQTRPWNHSDIGTSRWESRPSKSCEPNNSRQNRHKDNSSLVRTDEPSFRLQNLPENTQNKQSSVFAKDPVIEKWAYSSSNIVDELSDWDEPSKSLQSSHKIKPIQINLSKKPEPCIIPPAPPFHIRDTFLQSTAKLSKESVTDSSIAPLLPKVLSSLPKENINKSDGNIFNRLGPKLDISSPKSYESFKIKVKNNNVHTAPTEIEPITEVLKSPPLTAKDLDGLMIESGTENKSKDRNMRELVGNHVEDHLKMEEDFATVRRKLAHLSKSSPLLDFSSPPSPSTIITGTPANKPPESERLAYKYNPHKRTEKSDIPPKFQSATRPIDPRLLNKQIVSPPIYPSIPTQSMIAIPISTFTGIDPRKNKTTVNPSAISQVIDPRRNRTSYNELVNQPLPRQQISSHSKSLSNINQHTNTISSPQVSSFYQFSQSNSSNAQLNNPYHSPLTAFMDQHNLDNRSQHIEVNPMLNDNVERLKYFESKRNKPAEPQNYGQYKQMRLQREMEEKLRKEAERSNVEDIAISATNICEAVTASSLDNMYRKSDYNSSLGTVTNFKIPKKTLKDVVSEGEPHPSPEQSKSDLIIDERFEKPTSEESAKKLPPTRRKSISQKSEQSPNIAENSQATTDVTTNTAAKIVTRRKSLRIRTERMIFDESKITLNITKRRKSVHCFQLSDENQNNNEATNVQPTAKYVENRRKSTSSKSIDKLIVDETLAAVKPIRKRRKTINVKLNIENGLSDSESNLVNKDNTVDEPILPKEVSEMPDNPVSKKIINRRKSAVNQKPIMIDDDLNAEGKRNLKFAKANAKPSRRKSTSRKDSVNSLQETSTDDGTTGEKDVQHLPPLPKLRITRRKSSVMSANKDSSDASPSKDIATNVPVCCSDDEWEVVDEVPGNLDQGEWEVIDEVAGEEDTECTPPKSPSKCSERKETTKSTFAAIAHRRKSTADEVVPVTSDNSVLSTQNILTGKRRTRANVSLNESKLEAVQLGLQKKETKSVAKKISEKAPPKAQKPKAKALVSHNVESDKTDKSVVLAEPSTSTSEKVIQKPEDIKQILENLPVHMTEEQKEQLRAYLSEILIDGKAPKELDNKKKEHNELIDVNKEDGTKAIKPKKKSKNELDRLNEDIRDMFISHGVLTATGRRLCTIAKEKPVEEAKKVVVTKKKQPKADNSSTSNATKVVMKRGRKPKESIMSLENTIKMKTAKVVVQKFPLLGSQTPPHSTKPEYSKPCPKSKKVEYTSGESDSEDNLPLAAHTDRTKVITPVQSDAVEPAAVELTKEDVIEVKNTNSKLHTLLGSGHICAICGKKTITPATHYITAHKNSEVYTSRLPPEVLGHLKQNKYNNALYCFSKGKSLVYEYRCPFCDIQNQHSPKSWINHFSTHTGEYRFKCSECFRALNNYSVLTAHIKTSCPGATTIRGPLITQEDGCIQAYVCNLCNYTQMIKENLVSHLKIHHDILDQELFHSVTLLNISNVPKIDQFEGGGHVDDDESNASESEQHEKNSDVSEKHNEKQISDTNESLVNDSENTYNIAVTFETIDATTDSNALQCGSEIPNEFETSTRNAFLSGDVEESETTVRNAFLPGEADESSLSNAIIDYMKDVPLPSSQASGDDTSSAINEPTPSIAERLSQRFKDISEKEQTSNKQSCTEIRDINILDQFDEDILNAQLVEGNEEIQPMSTSTKTDKHPKNTTIDKEDANHREKTPPQRSFDDCDKMRSLELSAEKSTDNSLVDRLTARLRKKDDVVRQLNIDLESTRPQETLDEQVAATNEMHALTTDNNDLVENMDDENQSIADNDETGDNDSDWEDDNDNWEDIEVSDNKSCSSQTTVGKKNNPRKFFHSLTQLYELITPKKTSENSKDTPIENNSEEQLLAKDYSKTDVPKTTNISDSIDNLLPSYDIPADIVSGESFQDLADLGDLFGSNFNSLDVHLNFPDLDLVNNPIIDSAGSFSLISKIDQNPIMTNGSLQRIENVGFSICDKAIKYRCLVAGCPFMFSDEAFGLETHVQKDHANIIWDGYCYMCIGNVSQHEEQMLSEEVKHMLEVHCKNAICTDNIKETDQSKDTRPMLKIRRMSGDMLSVKKNSQLNVSTQFQNDFVSNPESVLKISSVSQNVDNELTPESCFQISNVRSLNSAQTPAPATKRTFDLQIDKVISLHTPMNEIHTNDYMTRIDKSKSESVKQLQLTETSLFAKYKCMNSDCSYVTSSTHDMTEHLRSHLIKKDVINSSLMQCAYCDYIAMTVADYLSHTDETHGRDIYQCPYCFYRACEDYSVYLHLEYCHPKKELRILVCTGQVKELSAEMLDLTVYKRKNVRGIPCSDCTKVFFVIKNFLNHIRRHHSCYNIDEFKCALCSSGKDISKQSAEEHLRQAHNISMHECLYCTDEGSSSTDKNEIANHIAMRHPSNLMYICTRMPPSNYKQTDLESVDGSTTITSISQQWDNAIIKYCPNTEMNPSDTNVSAKETPFTPEITDTPTMNDVKLTEAKISAKNSIIAIKGILRDAGASKNNEKVSIEDAIKGLVEDTGISQDELYRCVYQNCLSKLCESTYVAHLQQHAANSAPFTSYKCCHCSHMYKHPSAMTAHLRIHMKHSYFCYICCTFTAVNLVQMTKHFGEKHSDVQHPTPLLISALSELKFYVMCPKIVEDTAVSQFSEKLIRIWENKVAMAKKSYRPHEWKILPHQPIFGNDVFCDVCNYKTKVRTNMIRHLQMHEQEVHVSSVDPVNPVPCLNSSEKHFDKMTNLACSSNAVPDNKPKTPEFVTLDNRFKCGVEGCTYLTKEGPSMLKRHINTLHNSFDQPYTCPHCKDIVCRGVCVERILQHLKLHDNVLYQCDLCSYFHYNKATVDRHIGDKHASMKINLVTLTRDEHGTQMYKQEYNSKKGKTDNYEISSKSADNGNSTVQNNLMKWECTLCKHQTANYNQMISHTNSKHHCKTKYQCAHCPFGGQHVANIMDHITEKHPTKVREVRDVFKKINESEQDKGEDTRPLWLRYDPKRVRNIRGILMQEDDGEQRSTNGQSDDSEDDLDIASNDNISSLLAVMIFHCYHCAAGKFENFDKLKQHWKAAHWDIYSDVHEPALPLLYRISKTLVCARCKSFSGSKADLLQHNLTKHNSCTFAAADAEKTDSCGYCNFEYSTADILAKHIADNHINSEMKNFTHSALRDVLSLGESQSFLQCYYCARLFANQHNLTEHEKSEHFTNNLQCVRYKQIQNENIYMCTSCDYTSPNEMAVLRHMIDHYEAFKQCKACQLQFDTFNSFLKHYQTAHPADTRKFREHFPKAPIFTFFTKMLVLFPNGFVIEKYSLRMTPYGSRDKFQEIYTEMFKKSQESQLAFAWPEAPKKFQKPTPLEVKPKQVRKRRCTALDSAEKNGESVPAIAMETQILKPMKIKRRRNTERRSVNYAEDSLQLGATQSALVDHPNEILKRRDSYVAMVEPVPVAASTTVEGAMSSGRKRRSINYAEDDPLLEALIPLKIAKRRQSIATGGRSVFTSSIGEDEWSPYHQKSKRAKNIASTKRQSSVSLVQHEEGYSYYGTTPTPFDLSQIKVIVPIEDDTVEIRGDRVGTLFNMNCNLVIDKINISNRSLDYTFRKQTKPSPLSKKYI